MIDSMKLGVIGDFKYGDMLDRLIIDIKDVAKSLGAEYTPVGERPILPRQNSCAARRSGLRNMAQFLSSGAVKDRCLQE